MRTNFQEFDPDHLQIHDDLATEYNRTSAIDFSQFAAPLALDARDFGLGDGSTSDWQALTDFFTACSATTADPASGKIRAGVMGMIPSGTWAPVPPPVPYGSVFPVIAPASTNNGGSIWIVGQGSGSTTITTTGQLGHAFDLATATRGANSAVAPFSGNTFTLGFGSAHNAVVGQIIALRVISRGRPVWAHYTIIAVPDTTHIQYKAGGLDDGTGHTSSGGSLDLMIPPTTVTVYNSPGVPTTVNNTVYFCEYLLEPLNFKQPHAFFLDKLTLQAGTATGTPLDGFGVRISSRANFQDDCVVSDFWINGVYNGTPHVHPSIPVAAQVPQNTDHSWVRSKTWTSATYGQFGFIDNSSNSYFRKTGGPGLGGGRDNHIVSANVGQTGFAGIVCNDAGNFETLEVTGTNLKGGSYPILFEGVDGVDPVESTGIDCIAGWMKIESPGNYSFVMDETKRRSLQKTLGFSLRMEAGVDINGADTGTPGGAGSVAQGQFNDTTDKPWPAFNVSLSVAGAVPVLTATVPAAMFGTDGGCDIGTIVALGSAVRASTLSPYTGDGATVAGAAGVGTFSSASLGGAGGFSADDVGLRVDCVGLTGGSDTILSVTNASTVVMTHAVTGSGTGKAWVVKNDGTKTQSGVCHESRVATVTGPTLGLVTITMPRPDYAGGALPGPYTASCGDLGHIRAGSLHSWDPQVIFDTEALDRMCHAQQFIDVQTLTTGSISLTQDDTGPATRRVLPTFRVWDVLTRGGASSDGAISGSTFTSASGKFTQLDVGKVIFATGLNAGAGSDSISAVTNGTTVTTTHSGTTGSGLAWRVQPQTGLAPFRFLLRRGSQEFRLFWHDPLDGDPVGLGNPLAYGNAWNSATVVRSGAVKGALSAGIACSANPASNLQTITTNCDTGAVFNTATVGTGAARVLYNGSVIPVAAYPTVLSLGDDPNQLLSAPSTAITSSQLLVDNGDGTIVPAALTLGVPDAGQLVVGVTMHGCASVATTGAPVDAILCVPYWTT